MAYTPAVGDGIVFMKVGTHANETLADILKRKRKELSDAGVSFWGYGGNTCHPVTMVQPFAAHFQDAGKKVYLCMHEMNSQHFADPVEATQYSFDGKTWKAVPKGVHVKGSRYALILGSLEQCEFQLDLGATRVGVGLSKGRPGDQYIKGRVDKACLEVTDKPAINKAGSIEIALAAKLHEPFAVLLR